MVSTTLPAQFSLQLEQGIGLSGGIHHQPIGLSFNYQITELAGFNISLGLAYDQVTVKKDLIINPSLVFCDLPNRCLPFPASFVKSYESRLVLPFGLSRTVDRFTYGLQIRPGYRFSDRVKAPTYFGEPIVESKFGEDLPGHPLFSDNSTYRAEKSSFSLQLSTDFRYAVTPRIFIGLNYRYEGFIMDQTIIYRSSVVGIPVENDVFARGNTRAHFVVAAVGWKL